MNRRFTAAPLALTAALLFFSGPADADEAAAVAETASPASTEPAENFDPAIRRHKIYVGGAITLAVGTAVTALGAMGAVLVRQKYDEAALGCDNIDPPWGCSATAFVDLNEARTNGAFAIMALGTGAVTQLIGTILLSTAHLVRARVEPSASGVAFSVDGAF